MMVPSVSVDIPRKLKPLITSQRRYNVVTGGRGSAKSWTFARVLLALGLCRPLFVMCGREFQRSIKDSVHRLLAQQVDALGLGSVYQVNKTEIVSKYNGTRFAFVGLHHHVESIKSLESVDIFWAAEAERISDHSWEVLIPTIRRPGSQIWIEFNPAQETDPTYRRFVKGAESDPDIWFQHVRYTDNPWCPDVLKKEAERLRRTDPEAYEHIWGGTCWTRSDSQIFAKKWCVDEVIPKPHWDGPYYGADWGFAQDPTVLVKCWVEELGGVRHVDAQDVPHRILHIEDGVQAVGCEILDTPELFDRVSGSRKRLIRADCARPETISHVRNAGFDIEGAEKWSGSVEDGIAFLRSFDKIVIAPHLLHMIEEARLYSYKLDRLTGDVLPEVKDAYNHWWDAIRYALDPMIRSQGVSIFNAI